MKYLLKVKRLILISVLGIVFIPVFSYSAEKEIVKVAWYEGQGFQYYDEEGEPAGYNYEYLKAIESRTDIEFQYVDVDWQDAFKMLENNEVDIIGGITLTEEGLKDYDYCSLPNGTSSIMIIAKKISPIGYNDYDGLNGKKVAVLNSQYRIDMFKDYQNRKGFSVEPVICDDNKQVLELLDRGEVDAAIEVSMYNFSGYKIIAQFDTMPFYFITRKSGDNDFMEEISDAIADIKIFNFGFDKDLTEKYLTGENRIGFSLSENAYIKSKGELRIGIKTGRKLLGYVDGDGNIRGIEADIAEAIGSYCGMNVTLVQIDSCAKSQEFLDENDLDLVIGATQHKDDTIRIVPYMEEQRQFVIKRGAILSRDISFTKIAIPKNAQRTKEYIEKEYPKWEIIEEETETCLDYVVTGEADAAVVSKYELQYYMQIPKYEDIAIMPNLTINDEKGLIISSSEPYELYSVVNKAVNYLNNGEIDYIIYDNLAKNSYEYSFVDLLIDNILQILLLIIIVGVAILVYLYDNNRRIKNANKATEKALNEAVVSKIEAQEANAVKSDFLSRMSHDMRTPMSTVIGLSDFGIEESKDENLKGYFKQIRESSEYLLGLLNDILDMQSLEYGSIKLTESKTYISDLINDSMNMIIPLAKNKDIKVNCKKINIDDGQIINIDKLRVSQVINNILSNAIKYTNSGGRVDWTIKLVKKNNGEIFLHNIIKDTGVGISKEFLDKIFEPFSQEKNELTYTEGGSGLGLAICKNLVELMGGEISCKSQLNKGSEFEFKIPIKSGYSERKSETKQELLDDLDKLKNKKVLLCEDNEINARILTKVLINKGMLVDWAKNGREGVDKAFKAKYDIILMDIRMPIMDGIEAAIKIREKDENIPIIALSANAYSNDVEKSVKAGMNAHLSKPVNYDDLFSTVLVYIK
jgi:signal transduction histidine kinase/BarA-like signal transduction histidine kinase